MSRQEDVKKCPICNDDACHPENAPRYCWDHGTSHFILRQEAAAKFRLRRRRRGLDYEDYSIDHAEFGDMCGSALVMKDPTRGHIIWLLLDAKYAWMAPAFRLSGDPYTFSFADAACQAVVGTARSWGCYSYSAFIWLGKIRDRRFHRE